MRSSLNWCIEIKSGEWMPRGKGYVTIPLLPETRARLHRFMRRGESYDSVINRLMLERTKELELPREHLTLEKIEDVMGFDQGVPIDELRSQLKI